LITLSQEIYLNDITVNNIDNDNDNDEADDAIDDINILLTFCSVGKDKAPRM